MTVSRPVAVMLVVLVILESSAAIALTGPSHPATAGVVYETNSGLEATLGADREVEAAPFPDDNTFASQGVELEATGPAEARLPDAAFSGSSMQVTQIDATSNAITLRRDDLSSNVVVSGGTDGIIVASDITLDDGAVDLTVDASSATSITVDNLPTVDGIQAVDSTGTPVAGSTTVSGGSVTLDLDAGQYQLRLQQGPSRLEVRDLVNQTLINQGPNGSAIEVEVEFFGSNGTVERRTTTTGTIDMSGLPADQRFSVSVDAGDDYVQRQIIVESLLQQQTAYLLPASTDIDTVEPRFLLEDPSSQFDTERSEIVLERPINTGNGTEFVAVAGDRVGLNGFDTILERDQRYRVIVTDPESGSQRELGAFTPTQSEQVTLTVEDVEFDSVAQVEGLEWAATYQRNEDSQDQIRFIYRDELETQTLEYRIHERGNESNQLVAATASGNVTVTQPVPTGQENTVWVVNWSATRGSGEQLSASRPVSTGRLPVGPGLAPEWQTLAAMFGLFVVAGLFGAASPGIGGIAVAATGGLFFLLGWLPDSTGGIMVALALFIAVLAYAGRKARGATA